MVTYCLRIKKFFVRLSPTTFLCCLVPERDNEKKTIDDDNRNG